MNFYKLEESYLVEDYYGDIDIDYVMHEKRFSEEEFLKICKECLDKCDVKCISNLIKELENLGFKKIEPIVTFEFDYID